MRFPFHLVAAIAVVGGSLTPSSAIAQPSNAAFRTLCQQRVTNVQTNRRICVIGVVTGPARVRVLFSTRANLVGRTVEVYSSTPMDPTESPIPEFGSMTNRVVGIGGFENSTTIYSARIL